MKIQQFFILGLRNIWVHRKRQIFLVFALLLCFALISLMTFVSEGMKDNVYQLSRLHYGGDLFVSGYYGNDPEKPAWINQPEVLDGVNKNIEGTWVKRSQLFKRGTLYFNGKPQLMKYVVGLDYHREKDFLSHFEVIDGSLDNLEQEHQITVSQKLAANMGMVVGDQIILKTTNHKGQIGSGHFIIGAILEDSTLLGYYRIFMRKDDLNALIGWGTEEYSSLGFYLNNPKEADLLVPELRAKVNSLLPGAGIIIDRDDYYREIEENWKDVKYMTFSLSVYIAEVDDLLQALDYVSFLVYLLMLAISLVSVLVTYQIILHDRSREMAMLQAIGMTQGEVEGVLMAEAFLVIGISIGAGFIVSLILLGAVGFVSFDWIPGFGIFLKQGKMTGTFSIYKFLINIGVIVLGVIPAVWRQVRKELKKPLAATLQGGLH